MNNNLIIIGAIGLFGYLAIRSAKDRLNAINPASPDNLINRAVTTASSNLFSTVGEPPAFLSDSLLIARATLLNPFASPASKEAARNFLAAQKFRGNL